jgi:hypothetical protein
MLSSCQAEMMSGQSPVVLGYLALVMPRCQLVEPLAPQQAALLVADHDSVLSCCHRVKVECQLTGKVKACDGAMP